MTHACPIKGKNYRAYKSTNSIESVRASNLAIVQRIAAKRTEANIENKGTRRNDEFEQNNNILLRRNVTAARHFYVEKTPRCIVRAVG